MNLEPSLCITADSVRDRNETPHPICHATDSFAARVCGMCEFTSVTVALTVHEMGELGCCACHALACDVVLFQKRANAHLENAVRVETQLRSGAAAHQQPFKKKKKETDRRVARLTDAVTVSHRRAEIHAFPHRSSGVGRGVHQWAPGSKYAPTSFPIRNALYVQTTSHATVKGFTDLSASSQISKLLTCVVAMV